VTGSGAGSPEPAPTPVELPDIGVSDLRIIKPDLLELTLITTKAAGESRAAIWDFIQHNDQARLPAPGEFAVTSAGKNVTVARVGFKRRVIYAPLKVRDLRIGNYLYLQLSAPTPEGAEVEVKNPSGKLWPSSTRFICTAAPLRWSTAIHANQTGYMLDLPHRARVGFYAGSLGEIEFAEGPDAKPEFSLVEALTSKEVFRGELKPRRDRGFPYEAYQHVLEADFTTFKVPGEYRLVVQGLGASIPFWLDNSVAGAFARANALGIYHQRCGTANTLPFTRFTHDECHTAPAEVPTLSEKFKAVNKALANESANFKNNPRHTAPQLKDVAASLYSYVNRGPIDVRGGHHDAGDYSKYTINSAGFVHHLVLAADIFPGVSDLDNLGLPESGDGKSDVLQEAKWEADFLAKMQDADGGFYFLVYPRDRAYEQDVTPDKGDPQVVFPKTTSVTAAATAALAQCASSPTFKKQFPEASAFYLQRAKQGWSFLERAIAKFGKDGAYQKITHYGDDFMHDDELAWAACELFLATGENSYARKVAEWLDPSAPEKRKWGWWRLYDAWGCAIRSYAFAAISGRLKPDQLDPLLLARCQEEVAAAGQDQLRRSEDCA
ncbi:MAG TPA: glycoside hydrolase family 9 protein, partial [Verrucomicrobiae bacterium]